MLAYEDTWLHLKKLVKATPTVPFTKNLALHQAMLITHWLTSAILRWILKAYLIPNPILGKLVDDNL